MDDNENHLIPTRATVIVARLLYDPQLWGLTRNAISDACRWGALRGRKSGQIWLVTVVDMLHYQNGRYWPNRVSEELKPAFDRAIAKLKATE